MEDLDKVANEAADIEPSPDPEKPKSNNKKVMEIFVTQVFLIFFNLVFMNFKVCVSAWVTGYT